MLHYIDTPFQFKLSKIYAIVLIPFGKVIINLVP